MHGARHAVMVSSGTAGLQMAYQALGVKKGVDFALPSMTFVATANAGVVLGGRPVFCDIESVQRPTIDVRNLAKRLTPRTKVVAAVHYGGYPADVRRLAKFCRDKGLALVEDCAHCPDTRVGKKHLGLWGNAGVFSFFSNKNLSTGEGGAILTNDDALADELRGLRSHGMTALSWERYRGAAVRYDVLDAGYNFRPTEPPDGNTPAARRGQGQRDYIYEERRYPDERALPADTRNDRLPVCRPPPQPAGDGGIRTQGTYPAAVP
jgi:dTDP-4-amino-4,6-dideoxygalactose transaminase